MRLISRIVLGQNFTVIAGRASRLLSAPAIHKRLRRRMRMDGRHQAGHDDVGSGSLKSKLPLAIAVSLALALSSCGVKNDLVLPDGKPTPKGQKDPSKPPAQQQQGI